MNPLPLTVCMISGAEAHRIGRTLESVAGWTTDLIAVLNTEVADGTDALIERFGGKVFREPWKGFIGQKNSAAAKANQPWLLNLDADEVVTPLLREEIESAVRADGRGCAAFEFPRCTFFCGRWIRHGDWYPDRVLRLWRREAAVWAGEEPHARLAVEGGIGRLRGDLLHYSNDSVNGTLAKIGPYSDYYVKRRLTAGRGGTDRWDMFGRPLWKFLRAYVLRRGFLDGWPGYYIAWMNAFSTVTRHAKVLEARLSGVPAPDPGGSGGGSDRVPARGRS